MPEQRLPPQVGKAISSLFESCVSMVFIARQPALTGQLVNVGIEVEFGTYGHMEFIVRFWVPMGQ